MGFELVGGNLDSGLAAVMRAVTIVPGFTLRNRMKMIWTRLTGALERMDCHQSQKEFQMRANTTSTMIAPITMPMSSMIISVQSP